MGVFDIFSRKSAAPEKKGINESLGRLIEALSGDGIASGVVVTESTAVQVATVAACLNLIASDVATLPLKVKKQAGSRLDDATDRPEWSLLMSRPNPDHTAYEFRQMVTAQAVLRGTGYAFKMRNSAGETRELWPLMTREVQPRRVGTRLVYHVNAYDGAIAGEFEANRLLRVRNMMWDGMTGLDRLKTARENIGLASAAAGTQGKAFSNGTRMPGYWTTDNSLDDEAVERLAEQLQAATTGSNAYKSPLVDMGVNYKPTGQSFQDAQLVEARKHQIIEVCAAFGVVPAVLGIDDKTQAFASVEAMMRWHLQHTLRPWLTAWEQALDRDVLDGADGPYMAKFDTSDMEKASTADRAQSYRDLVELGVMTRNEARALEGLPPLEGLDEPLTPLNMQDGTKKEAGNGQEP